MHIAIQSGAPQSVLEMLVKAAPDVISLTDKFGRTCLHLAVGDAKTVDKMIVTTDSNTLGKKYQDKNPVTTVEVIELLHSLDPKQIKTPEKVCQNLPLHTACQGGCSVNAVKVLVQTYPAAIHIKNKDGMRPLEVARTFGNCSDDVIYLLELSEEADVDV